MDEKGSWQWQSRYHPPHISQILINVFYFIFEASFC